MIELPLKPKHGGFLRPFGYGWFIREFLSGNSPSDSAVIDPDAGACQADIFYHYKNALRRTTAMDMVEEDVNQAIPYLEQARIVATEARKIANLPQYVDDRLVHIISEIDRTIGGSQHEPVGRLQAGIRVVRDSLPSEALEEERASLEYGRQQALIT